MKINKISVAALAAALPLCMAAQDLNQHIVLDKDFRPVVKKVTKKKTEPSVIKPVKTAEGGSVDYSTWAQPTAVSTEIPTMLPYGYRTSHIFSHHRGYLDLGAGTQINFTASAGYRLLDEDNTTADLWLQHNSSWNGKNATPIITDNALRLKQKFNDNVVGFDAKIGSAAGTLKVGAKVHIDHFNYYGGLGTWWDDNKQTLVDAQVHARWDGTVSLSDKSLRYHGTAGYAYAGYNKSFTDLYNGAKDLHPHIDLGASYELNQTSKVGLNAYFDLIDRSIKPSSGDKLSRTTYTLTLSPYYGFNTEHVTTVLGANVAINHNDGPTVRITPNVSVSAEVQPGFALYAKAIGRKCFNTIGSMAALNRYSDPLAGYRNTACVVDGEAGLKIGPFSGFTAQLHVGYGAFNNQLMAYIPKSSYLPAGADASTGAIPVTSEMRTAAVFYTPIRTRGFNAGAELNYKYRSLVEVLVKGAFAPQEENLEGNKYKSYLLGLDNAEWTATAEIKAYPIKALNVNVGIELRGGRRALMQDYADDETTYSFTDLDDVANLYAGASYRFDKVVTIWAKAANLLGKRYDVLYGQGAQRTSVMGGIGLVF